MKKRYPRKKRPRMSRLESICCALNCLVFATIWMLCLMGGRSYAFLVPSYFSAVAFVLLVQLCLGAIWTLKKRSWTSLTGTILKVGTRRDEEWLRTSSERGTTIFAIVMSVSYEVEGKVYTVKDKEIDNLNSSSRREVMKIARQYEPGQSIGVRYNPKDPSEAIIIAGPRQIGFGLLVMTAVISGFVGCGILAVYLYQQHFSIS